MPSSSSRWSRAAGRRSSAARSAATSTSSRRSGTNTLHGTVYGFFRDDAFNGKNALTGTTLPMDQQQFGASVGGPLVRNRTFYFANVEQQAARPDRRRHDPRRRTSPAINARLAQVGLSGPAGHHRHLSQPGAQHERARQGRPPVERRRSAQRPLRALRRDVGQRARRRHAERPVRLDRPRQRRSVDRHRQRLDALAEHRQRDARAGRARRSEGATRPTRSGRR